MSVCVCWQVSQGIYLVLFSILFICVCVWGAPPSYRSLGRIPIHGVSVVGERGALRRESREEEEVDSGQD